MSQVENYYNTFYTKIAKLDEEGNSFKKIENIMPILDKRLKIIDIGCGYGSVSEELIHMGHEVYGVEINADAIDMLKKKSFIVATNQN